MTNDGIDLDLTGIAQRLNALNPDLGRISVEPSPKPDSLLRVIIETTKEQLQHGGGRLVLKDPALPAGARVETVVRLKGHQADDQVRIALRRVAPGIEP
jgi:hypothetical protein